MTTMSIAASSSSLPAPVARRRYGAALTIVGAMTRNALRGFVREPVGFVMQFLYPLFMLLIFNAVFPGEILGGVSYAQYLLPAMLTTGIMTTCLQHLAITVAGERESGALRRLAVMPTPAWAHVVSKILADAVLATANAAMLIAVAHWGLGIALPAGGRAWGLLALTTALMVGICTALGLAVGRSRPGARAASALVTPIVLVLQFVSGIFFPLAQLPSWMIDAASILPARWSAELMREALLPAGFASAEPTGAWETGKGLAVVTIWLVAAVMAAIIVTRRDTVDK